MQRNPVTVVILNITLQIKVEPPDIRDIDEDDAQEDWTTPRLIIDLVRELRGPFDLFLQ
jgi:hypothetical protein